MSLWKCFWQNCLWPLLILALLGLAQMFWPGGKWRSIEQDVSSTIVSNLNDNGFDWAKVDTHDRGRDVLLSGSAPSELAKSEAMRIASKLSQDKRGNPVARIVEWKGDIVIPKPDPGNLYISAAKGKVTLNGVVASDAEVQALVSAAQTKYGADNVTNRLIVKDNIVPVEKIADLVTGFGLNDGTLRLSLAGVVKVTGEVTSDEVKNTIGQNLINAMGETYRIENLISVKVPEPEPVVVVEPEPDKSEICQAKVLELMSSSKIFFESGKAQIKASSNLLLDGIAAILSECESASINVAGHTDSTGNEGFNIPLSQNRAQAVVDYLIAQGIQASRLSASGFGSAQPVADNNTKEGRATNRRIEFTVK